MSKAKRSGKYRHIYGDPAKPDKQFLEIKNPMTSGEGTYVKANTKFFAVARAGGGGPLYLRRFDDPGRFSANVPLLSVHKGKCWDFDFHPFIQTMIATASEDCRAAVSTFPIEGLTETITDAAVVLEGHQKKVTLVEFNPSANNILATGSFDRTVKVWNVETAECVASFDDFKDTVYSMHWSKDGSQLLTTSKDKQLRLFDPRNMEACSTVEAFDGGKSSKGFWVPRHGWVGACGFSKTAKRQMKLWDVRAMDKPLYSNNIDAAAGVLCPKFDDDNGVLYLAAKGEGSISYCELVDDDRKVYQLGLYRHTEPQKGGGWVPKRALDVWKCEVMRFMKLTKKNVIPISFIVPRKAGADVFQDDIFPDAPSGVPALSADEWVGGENKEPNTLSMDPAKRGDGDAEFTFVKKKTYSELAEENKALKEKITQLKEQVKSLGGEVEEDPEENKEDN